MERKNLWMRLLSLLLVCGMIVCCFAGCGGAGSTGDNDDDDDEKDKVSELRENLKKYEKNGLLVYLGDELEEMDYGFQGDDMYVSVQVFETEELEEELDVEITSAKKLMNAYSDFIEDEEDVTDLETGKANGTYYLYGNEDGDMAAVGFYYKDGYAWILSVGFEDEAQKDTAIKYATLGKVKSTPKADEDEDEEQKPVRGESAVDSTRPVATVAPDEYLEMPEEMYD